MPGKHKKHIDLPPEKRALENQKARERYWKNKRKDYQYIGADVDSLRTYKTKYGTP